MANDRDGGPLVSVHAEDPALREALEAFVVGLGERIDALQDLEIVGDLKRLGALATVCAEESARLGFGPFEAAARALAQACVRGERDEARASLVALTDVARRVRLGHRGAAI